MQQSLLLAVPDVDVHALPLERGDVADAHGLEEVDVLRVRSSVGVGRLAWEILRQRREDPHDGGALVADGAFEGRQGGAFQASRWTSAPASTSRRTQAAWPRNAA